jgi:hypothetical protein
LTQQFQTKDAGFFRRNAGSVFGAARKEIANLRDRPPAVAQAQELSRQVAQLYDLQPFLSGLPNRNDHRPRRNPIQASLFPKAPDDFLIVGVEFDDMQPLCQVRHAIGELEPGGAIADVSGRFRRNGCVRRVEGSLVYHERRHGGERLAHCGKAVGQDELQKVPPKFDSGIVEAGLGVGSEPIFQDVQAPRFPFLEDPEQTILVLGERHQEPAEPRDSVKDKLPQLLDITPVEPGGGDGVKIRKDLGMGCDQRPVGGVLAPALVGHVRKNVAQQQPVSILEMDRRFGQRGEQVELRFRVVESERIHQEVDRFAEVFHSLFGKPGDQGDGGGDMMAVRAPDPRSGLRQVQVLVDDALQAAGSGFDAEENVPATRPGHQGDQLGVDAIGSCAATLLKSTRPHRRRRPVCGPR